MTGRDDPEFDNADVEMEREQHKAQIREMEEQREKERQRHADREQILERRMSDKERVWQEMTAQKDEEMARLRRAHADWEAEEKRVMEELKDKHAPCDELIAALRRQIAELESRVAELLKEIAGKDEDVATARTVSEQASASLSAASVELGVLVSKCAAQERSAAMLRTRTDEVLQRAAGKKEWGDEVVGEVGRVGEKRFGAEREKMRYEIVFYGWMV